MEINLELLINLIEERPVLWDKTAEVYKNKRITYDAWKDVCKHIDTSFDEMDPKQKNIFGALVMKKWANMRDSWMKYAKKVKECKSGSGAKNIKKYVFYDQMSFLKKVADHRHTISNLNADTSNDSVSNENTVDLTTRVIPKKSIKKPTEVTEVDKRFMKFLDNTEKEDSSRIMNFFKGIAPTVDLFTDDDIIEFQSEVLQIIKNIKKKHHTLNPWTRNQYHNLQTVIPSTNVGTYGYRTQGYSSYSESQPSTSTTLQTDEGYEQQHETRPESQSSYISTDSVYSEIDQFDFNV